MIIYSFPDDHDDFDINYLIDRNLQVSDICMTSKILLFLDEKQLIQKILIENVYFQVSYLIVDQAEEDVEMSQDPFLEAGISIPETIPYQPKTEVKQNNDSLRDLKDSNPNIDPKEDVKINILKVKIVENAANVKTT